ncbi:glycerophosphodiester phosphodiesterase [Oryzibacter oryziterrae]|uniref:glycerophosphodiester phosphodiesterase n=1 Tax=Oryzibacter oryziterrae TaxID=2766474 RepID=UPI001F1FA619|nr:glycerophosphodiester phosphodiesterase family protein [Oryzibacter oryziterrae]
MPETLVHDTAPGLDLYRDGHRTRLKWHMGRRLRDDVPFTPARMREAMALGASFEVDLNLHAERGFAVLHDETVDRETNGSGPLAQMSVAEIRRLNLRRDSGEVTADKVQLLDDLAAVARSGGMHPDTLIQLDMKSRGSDIDADTVSAFAETLTGVAQYFIVSGMDRDAIARLGRATPGIAVGFDPCGYDTVSEVAAGMNLDAFVADAIAALPEARLIYLDYQAVLAAADRGYDLIGAFHREGRRIDAYTLDLEHPFAEDSLARLLGLKADQITTNAPDSIAARAVELGLASVTP